MTIGRNIRKTRNYLEMTQAQLAKSSGLSHSEISMLENDAKKNIPIEVLTSLAAALGTTSHDLVFGGYLDLQPGDDVNVMLALISESPEAFVAAKDAIARAKN